MAGRSPSACSSTSARPSPAHNRRPARWSRWHAAIRGCGGRPDRRCRPCAMRWRGTRWMRRRLRSPSGARREENAEGGTPTFATSIFKLYRSELTQRRTEMIVSMMGSQRGRLVRRGLCQRRAGRDAVLARTQEGRHHRRRHLRSSAQHHRQACARSSRLETAETGT